MRREVEAADGLTLTLKLQESAVRVDAVVITATGVAKRQMESQVSTGDRSAKIRTYNFPQSRVTDHRINLTLHDLPRIMDGDIGRLIEALKLADTEERLREGNGDEP